MLIIVETIVGIANSHAWIVIWEPTGPHAKSRGLRSDRAGGDVKVPLENGILGQVYKASKHPSFRHSEMIKNHLGKEQP